MRKKILGTLGFAGMMVAATSCSDDLKMNVGGEDGDIIQVTFTLSKEGAVGTRADGNIHYPESGQFPQISDGSKAKRLVWAVYDKDGNLLPEIGNKYPNNKTELAGYGQVVEDVDKFPHEITLRLVRGQEYSFAFWAQDPKCKAFNTDNLRAVSVDYKTEGNNLANDELRDAFCKVETFTVTSAESQKRTIILKRPFAQVNVGIPASEYESLRQSGIRIKKSKIHMENVATEFDVVSNSTHGDDPSKRQAIDFEYNYIPAYYNYDIKDDSSIPTDEKMKEDQEYSEQHSTSKVQYLKIDLNHDGTIEPYGEQNSDDRDETYNYMLMAYILPADRNDGTSTYSTTLDRVEFSLQTEKEGQADLTFSLENVPVQRNWRTNIFGRMFTSNVILEIDLDPIYSGDYNYPEWQRIYEGVTYDAMADCIYISNGAGLAWLSMATNGKWATQEAFEADNTHNLGAPITNDADLFLKAVKLDSWPASSKFHFQDVTIKLTSDIDLKTYAEIFDKDGYFTPIGLSDNSAYNNRLDNEYDGFFAGIFDGQNHTIYNLKTKPVDESDANSMGLFSTIGRNTQIKNVRLKDVDIQGHYRVGGIAGLVYSSYTSGGYEDGEDVGIFNCYVDGGSILSTSRNIGNNTYDDANNIGGIVGLFYNSGTVADCFVRNVNIRAYRAVSGIIGQVGGDYQGDLKMYGNKVYDVNIIADQYQEYGDDKDMEIKNELLGKDFYSSMRYNKAGTETNAPGENQFNNVKIYAFDHPGGITNIKTEGFLANPPLEIFPRLAKYADNVNFYTSILGGPSAYKSYDDDSNYKGTPDTKSGKVGLWVSGLTLNGYAGVEGQYLDNPTITASGLGAEEDSKDAVLFIKGGAVINNLTFHSSNYAAQAICLAPESGETIKFDGVLAYDAKRVLTDDGKVNGGTLTVKDSNFRGYVSLSEGYETISFDNTTFDGSSKRYDDTTNKLEINTSGATISNCKFVVEKGSDFVIDVKDGNFSGCVAYVAGYPDKTIEIKGNCTISVDDEGNVTTN